MSCSVYLRADPEVCYRRLKLRDRKEEAGVPYVSSVIVWLHTVMLYILLQECEFSDIIFAIFRIYSLNFSCLLNASVLLWYLVISVNKIPGDFLWVSINIRTAAALAWEICVVIDGNIDMFIVALRTYPISIHPTISVVLCILLPSLSGGWCRCGCQSCC